MIYVATGYETTPTLHAVDSSGKEQWSVTLNQSTGVSAVYASNGLVYACTQFTPPTAYDAKTGAVRWTFPTAGLSPAGPGGSISLNQGVLYFVNSLTVYAIDPATGDKIWEIDNETNIPPAVTGNKVIVAYNGAEAAFDRQTAAPIWKQTGRSDIYPSVTSLMIAAALGNAYIYEASYIDVIDTATGALKFSINTTGLLGQYITSSDSLLYMSSLLGIYCYNVINGTYMWAYAPYPSANDYYGTPIVATPFLRRSFRRQISYHNTF